MSAIGTKRTCGFALQMSAFGGKADMVLHCKCPLLTQSGRGSVQSCSGTALQLMRCRRLLRRKMFAGERISNQNLLLVLTVFEYAGLIRITRWEVIMPQPRKFRLPKPPIGQRRCPACGLPMFLVCIEPTDDAGKDERTFECSKCAYAETVIVKFR